LWSGFFFFIFPSSVSDHHIDEKVLPTAGRKRTVNSYKDFPDMDITTPQDKLLLAAARAFARQNGGPGLALEQSYIGSLGGRPCAVLVDEGGHIMAIYMVVLSPQFRPTKGHQGLVRRQAGTK
jgi:hypothetical protein